MSVEGSVIELEQRGGTVLLYRKVNRNGRSLLDNAKPFCIPKRWVWEAYKRVKANRGAAGVDEQSIEQFEVNLEG